MASVLRRGRIPAPPTGMSEFIDEIYSIKGFYGPWTMIYRKRNAAHVTAASDDALIYQGLDLGMLTPSDADDPEGEPVVLMEGPSNAVALSGRRERAPFAEKNVDRHQIRFYHSGEYVLETELGPLKVKPGDFAVIPASLIYREVPVEPGQPGAILIFESEQPIQLAENLWDSVGFAGMFIDYSEMELPEPSDRDTAQPTRVRLRYDGEWKWLDYEFDPTQDAIGWLGDPVIYKLNVWDIPGIGTSHSFLTPPANAVLWGENYSCFFNLLGPKPMPSVPPPRGGMGAPAHLNDYDEVWFKHASEFAPETVGNLWCLPRTLPHPGLKRPPEYPPNPPRQVQEMNINFDTRGKLRWTDVARKAWFPDPQVRLYTSLYGTHVGAVPEAAMRFAESRRV